MFPGDFNSVSASSDWSAVGHKNVLPKNAESDTSFINFTNLALNKIPGF